MKKLKQILLACISGLAGAIYLNLAFSVAYIGRISAANLVSIWIRDLRAT